MNLERSIGGDWRAELGCFGVIAVVCGALFFANLGRAPFFNKGEPREALVVRDIVMNGNWLFPEKEGGKIPSKPPLFHWSGALVSRLSGNLTDATVRFPSALYAALGVLLIYVLGRNLYDRGTALAGALILATTMIYQVEAVQARVDMTLSFYLTLTLALFYGIYRRLLTAGGWIYCFFFVLGLGVLAKGPVSLILNGCVIAVFLGVRKEWKVLFRFGRHPGVILAMSIVCFWYGAALWQGGEKFFGLQLVKENFARFFAAGEDATGHQKPWYYFFPYLFSQGLPWTLFLPMVVLDGVRHKWLKDENLLFLTIWAVIIFAFFSLSAGKRSVYILPLYAPLSLVIAVWFQQCREKTLPRIAGMRILACFSVVMGAFLFWILLGDLFGKGLFWFSDYLEQWLKPKDFNHYVSLRDGLGDIGWFARFSLWGCVILWFSAAVSLFRFRPRSIVIQFVCLSVLSGMLAQGTFVPALANARSYKAFIERADREFGRSGPLYLFPLGFDKSSVVFYAGDRIRLLPPNYDLLKTTLENPGAAVIMGETEFDAWRGFNGRPIRALLRSEGSGPEDEDHLVLVRKSG